MFKIYDSEILDKSYELYITGKQFIKYRISAVDSNISI
jgi:hypothetical protein